MGNKNKKRIPWNILREKYVQDETLTFADLAEEFECNPSTIADRSSAEGWTEQRRNFLDKVRKRADELALRTEAKRRADQLKISDSMKALAIEGLRRELEDIQQNKKRRLGLADIRLMLKDATEIERKALGMPDVVAMSDDELNATILRLTAELADDPGAD